MWKWHSIVLCNKYGTDTHIGIDLSPQAIKSAIEKSKMIENGNFQFLCGGIEALKGIQDESMDSAIYLILLITCIRTMQSVF